MRANRNVANLHVADVDTAKGFCADHLGLRTEKFNMGWVAGYTSPETGANIHLVTRDATSSADSAVSVLTEDVDSAYAEAQELGFTWSRASEGRSPARASRVRGRPR
ncbi:VOC family protein [Streptomyces sp. NPDC058695]|uniref:VOC family protein n=1 Tax=Streptomyces sp. NPDC058695 TaxID=3346604 RepID=UPI003656C1B4